MNIGQEFQDAAWEALPVRDKLMTLAGFWHYDENLCVIETSGLGTTSLGASDLSTLVGVSLWDIIEDTPDWSWITWTGKEEIANFMLELITEAKEFGTAWKKCHYVVPSQMLYPGIMCCRYGRDTGHYFVYSVWFDDVACGDPVSKPVWTDGNMVYSSNGSTLAVEDIALIEDYTRTENIQELADMHGMTRKAMDHKLKKIALKFGASSLTEMVKKIVAMYMESTPRSENTLILHVHTPELDDTRHRKLPARALPNKVASKANNNAKTMSARERFALLKSTA